MPGRTTPLVVGDYYHLYNRGTEKKDIFFQPKDYKRFQKTFYYYQYAGPKPRFSKLVKSKLFTFTPDSGKQLVEILCYCLMPNHYHFLVRQIKENGISIFMSQLSNSFTKYINTKCVRIGPLLQGAFKAVRIESDEQLIHTSRYIHLNPLVSGIITDLNNYEWSSYIEYVGENPTLCQINQVLSYFPSSQNYIEFIKDQADYATSIELFKHNLIDEF